MPFKKIIYYCIALMFLTSCKAFKNLTSSSYGSTNYNHQKASDSTKGKHVRFLNDIEVTPGSTVKSQHIIKKDKHQAYPGVEVSQVDPSIKMVDLESVDKLQLKYAVVMDAYVENLTNTTLLQKIDEWWGTQYCYGGNTKNCTDCSAFTQTMLQDVYKIKMPRTAQEQYNTCDKIDEGELHEGDLVFFHGTAGRRGPYISHVGIYLSNNKFVHASSNYGVTISDLNDAFYRKHFAGGGRAGQPVTTSSNQQ
jgi:Cell wall-associated hydrolases (invasion-associated proteins)